MSSAPATSRIPSRRDRIAGGVVDDRVGEADRGSVPVRVGGVVALDRGGDRRLQAPAADEDGADQRVVDPELATLAADALLGVLGAPGRPVARRRRAGRAPACRRREAGRRWRARRAGRCEPPRRPGRRRAGRRRRGGGTARRRAARRRRRRRRRRSRAGSRSRDPVGVSARRPPARPPTRAGGPVAVVGGAHHRDRQRGVGLDRLGDIAGRLALAVAEAHQAAAGLGERGHPGDRFERLGEARRRLRRAVAAPASWQAFGLQWSGLIAALEGSRQR